MERPDDITPSIAEAAEDGHGTGTFPLEERSEVELASASPSQHVLGAWSLAGLIATLGLGITLIW